MSWVERTVEERLARAAAAGELDTPHLSGRELDLDTPRGPGWWAERFVRRERSHDRRIVAVEAASVARSEFWRAESVDELRGLVRRANDAIDLANLHLLDTDRIDPFVSDDVVDRWRRLRSR